VWKVDVLLSGNWRGATSALISNGRDHIVVDTGMPHEAHQLVDALQKRSIHPSDVHTVVNTHFHIDHVLNNVLFPKSVIYASQESYQWCRSAYSALLDEQNWPQLALKFYPETFEYERAEELMGKLRKLALRWWDPKRLGDPSQFRWVETQALPDGLQCLMTSGHVPGHVSLIVNPENGPTVVAGDALLTRENDEQVLTMIPHNRQQFCKDRARILAMQARILPGHDRDFSTISNSEGNLLFPPETLPRT
jgi:glyoxylase-like metal-dependent hydrolase (beta-lactamase superfamily II)